VAQEAVAYFVLVHGKIIAAFFFTEMDLYIGVEPEAVTQCMIKLPAKLVVLYGGNNTQQPRVGKKIFCEFVYVQFQLHALWFRKRKRFCFKIAATLFFQ
jgi:hypothetical protein